MSPQPVLVTSRYNFRVPVDGGALLYNSNTGAVLRFSGRDALALARALSENPNEVPEDSLPGETYAQLLAGGFVIPREKDELAEIRARFHRARHSTPIVLTITTTADCNLGCYYCYEKRTEDRLELKDVEAVVALAEERLERSGKRSLHVDWYGGEPLMNLEFLEAASLALQSMCERGQIGYSASIISNGTRWPEDVEDFVRRHKIRQAQISFDGLRENHDRRRHYRKGYAPEGAASSFDQAAHLMDRLLDHVRVDVRINIDRANREDVIPFMGMARSRGWFSRRYKAVIQPARLASYSERSSFMRDVELSLDEFDAIRALVRSEAGIETSVEESEAPDGFPFPKTSVCAALADDSVVVGADGKHYRCGLQVTEPHRAVGRLRRETPKRSLPVFNPPATDQSDESWWESFDPTTLPTCSRCSFLPICWGGCPKKHLEQDEHAIREQGAYWRKNLPRLIAEGVGETAPAGFDYGEQEQFRDGY